MTILCCLISDKEREDDEDEEIIRCVCNIYRDEGLMIQCEKCQVPITLLHHF